MVGRATLNLPAASCMDLQMWRTSANITPNDVNDKDKYQNEDLRDNHMDCNEDRYYDVGYTDYD